MIELSAGDLHARVKPAGAELTSLRVADDEMLWQADPKVWARHAPLLFPIVGRLKNDTLLHAGKMYRMTQHGFARDRDFIIVESGVNRCRLRLEADEQTLASYPFLFRLDVEYALTPRTLSTSFTVTNNGDDVLPFSVGGHPAFRWPLPTSAGRDGYTLEFVDGAPETVWRLDEGLLQEKPVNLSLSDSRLMLSDELFHADALVFRDISSRGVILHDRERPRLAMTFSDFSSFGVWTKPGAAFVCLEPWNGFASPVSFAGEFLEKPGILTLSPGTAATYAYTVSLPS